ncbi:MAG: DUF2061 domain-containing protein [Thermoplasmatales archaeon]|nr:MAG: DUF2061 domain-containing protein [Thermoplasmatales archaeon]
MNELRKRSIVKSISYRIICIITLAIVSYIITMDIIKMTSIVVVFQSIQMIIYYFHERIWNHVKWGYI